MNYNVWKVFILLSIFLFNVNAYAVVQSIWANLASDSRAAVKEIVKKEVERQSNYSTSEDARNNLKDVQKEKDDEDTTYKSEIKRMTLEFTNSKKWRDNITTQYQTRASEMEELQKSIQNLEKGKENSDSNVTRFQQDIKVQQDSLEKWLRTEKQGETVVAVIYTRGIKDSAHRLEELADHVSSPLLAEHMGVRIRSFATVINNVLMKDIIHATTEGTAKPLNEEPLKIELKSSHAGTIYLRLKRYELFPFQAPPNGQIKPGKEEAERFKAKVVTSESELNNYLKENGFAGIEEGKRVYQFIDEVQEANRQGTDSLGSQLDAYRRRINEYKDKIESDRSEKQQLDEKLKREQVKYERTKGEVAQWELKKDTAEKELLKVQTNLQEKKRVRETIIIKDARAVPKGSETPANAISAIVIDKLEEVKNDARTQHSSTTTTVANLRVTDETSRQAVTDAQIISLRLISFINEGENGVKVQMAFRVRTFLTEKSDAKVAAPSPATQKPATKSAYEKPVSAAADTVVAEGKLESRILITKRMKLDVPTPLSSLTLRLPLPANYSSINHSQRTQNLAINCYPTPQEIEDSTDRFGNAFKKIIWNSINRDVQIDMSYDTIVSTGQPSLEPTSPFPLVGIPTQEQIYLQPTEYVQSNDPQIVKLAGELTRNAKTEVQAVNAILNYILGAVKYKYNPPHYDAVYTLSAKIGNVTNFAHFATALLRASGIPSRIVGGLALSKPWKMPIDDKRTLRNSMGQGSTAWIEVYFPGIGWFSCDPNLYSPHPIMQSISTRHIKEMHGIDYMDITLLWTGKPYAPKYSSTINADFKYDHADN